MRRSPQLMVMGLALAAAAACSESSSSRLMAPSDGASATKSSGGSGGTAGTRYTSMGGVTPTTYEGNTSGGGSSSCSALGFGSNGTKVDGASSQTIAGYKFTVSADKQSVSFAPVAGTTPTTAIVAVIVKGGPAYNVYDYSGNFRLSDGGLTSPLNGGGNIPQISHYVVCYGPKPVTPPPTLTKDLIDVMTHGSTPGSMISDPVWLADKSVVVIPIGETRWLDFELKYTLPAGVTGTITENSAEVCGTLGTFILQCSFNVAPTPNGIYSWNVSGSGSFLVMIDLGGGGGGSCGDRKFINTARLTTSTGTVVVVTKEILVRVVCAPAIKLTKTLTEVLKAGSTPGSMVPDTDWHPGETVVIPNGEIRWLHYTVSYTLPSGVTGTITENKAEVCGSLGTFLLQCSFDLAPTADGIYRWSVGSGTGSVMVPIDLGGGGAGSCGDKKFINTVRLTPSVGSVVTATNETNVRVVCKR
jgi:hypothetical protein